MLSNHDGVCKMARVVFEGAVAEIERPSAEAKGRGFRPWGASHEGGNPPTPLTSGVCGSVLAVHAVPTDPGSVAYLFRHGWLDLLVMSAQPAHRLSFRL